MRPLSYSQISLYRTCPLQYKFQYIDRLKPKDKWYFSFGTVLHSCAEYFFRVKVPPPPSLEQLLSFYEQNWLSAGFESAEEEESYRAFGKEILTRFWEIHNDNFVMPIAIERRFYLDIDGIKLTGFIDRADKTESGCISIVDYKSNQQLFTADYLENDLQLTLYQLAAQQLWRMPVEKLTLYHLRTNTPCSCPPRDEARLNEARQLVLDTAENIAAGEFAPTENEWCPCDFAELCPYYRQQYEQPAAEPEALDILRGMSVEQAVERYVSLQAQIKELELQFNDLRQIIIDYCMSKGYNRIFSQENAVTFKHVERTGYAEEEVRALLEPEGLWERVLGFNQSLVKDLLADENLPEEIKDRLRKVKKAVSGYAQLTVKKREEEK